MLLDKDIDSISFDDLDLLIQNKIREGKVIDYKLRLPNNTHKGKKEFLADVSSPGFHPLVKKAKDVAAGAVLIAAIGAAAIGLLVIGPYVIELFKN